MGEATVQKTNSSEKTEKRRRLEVMTHKFVTQARNAGRKIAMFGGAVVLTAGLMLGCGKKCEVRERDYPLEENAQMTHGDQQTGAIMFLVNKITEKSVTLTVFEDIGFKTTVELPWNEEKHVPSFFGDVVAYWGTDKSGNKIPYLKITTKECEADAGSASKTSDNVIRTGEFKRSDVVVFMMVADGTFSMNKHSLKILDVDENGVRFEETATASFSNGITRDTKNTFYMPYDVGTAILTAGKGVLGVFFKKGSMPDSTEVTVVQENKNGLLINPHTGGMVIPGKNVEMGM